MSAERSGTAVAFDVLLLVSGVLGKLIVTLAVGTGVVIMFVLAALLSGIVAGSKGPTS